jgi:hypothetical protein
MVYVRLVDIVLYYDVTTATIDGDPVHGCSPSDAPESIVHARINLGEVITLVIHILVVRSSQRLSSNCRLIYLCIIRITSTTIVEVILTQTDGVALHKCYVSTPIT